MGKPTKIIPDWSTHNGLADVLGRKRRKEKPTNQAGKGDKRRGADEDHCTQDQYEENFDKIDWSK